MNSILDRDTLNAFCRHTHIAVDGHPGGPLTGLACGIKDVFDIAGQRTGFGSPAWLASHPPATVTAAAVERLLDAGANVLGKTHTDELTFSLAGENAHYGTPVNVKAPGRIPGGSSSGSAAATAGGLVDFALGTDTGGSVRGPAALCGVYGMRPTHGRIPLQGARPLAPSMDTAGWFARDARLLETVGCVLLGSPALAGQSGLRRLLVATDAFALAESSAADAFAEAAARLRLRFDHSASIKLSAEGLERWVEIFRPLQGVEIWAGLGPWLEAERPALGPGIKERFAWAASLDRHAMPPLQAERARITGMIEAMLGDDAVILLPTLAGIAPLRGADAPVMEDFRLRAISLLSPAGLSGLPQISMPLAASGGCPLGLSLIGPRGSDEALLRRVRELNEA